MAYLAALGPTLPTVLTNAHEFRENEAARGYRNHCSPVFLGDRGELWGGIALLSRTLV
jgi:hypothetical protein